MSKLTLIAAVLLVGCSESPAEGTYPAGPFGFDRGDVVPPLSFPGVDASGAMVELSMIDHYREGELLVIQISGGLWCGTCRWPMSAEVVPRDSTQRVRRLDLVIGDRDHAPASDLAARAWQVATDSPNAVGADPEHRFQALSPTPMTLPVFVLIDTDSMEIREGLANPDPAALHEALSVPTDPSTTMPRVDGIFRPHEWALLQETTLLTAPPPSSSNRYADSAAAAALGRTLFFDEGLSPSRRVSCATCHRPELALADDRPQGHGVARGDRNTPPIALSSHARWQFWDGRADSLWAQALGPLEDARELDSSRAFVARHVLAEHLDAFRTAFPDEPIPDTDGWPAAGKPGDAAFDELSDEARRGITSVFVLVGKAIAAWERSLRVASNPLDAYLAGDFDALDHEQKYGLQLFVSHGCMQCHWGPRLTDDAFHNVGFPSGRRDGQPDSGRLVGLEAYRESSFRSDGQWSDAPHARSWAVPREGQFKTPPLRGVAERTYMGHGGTFGHLADVMEHYGWSDPQHETAAGRREPWLVPFGETVQWGLIPFLQLLTASPVVD